MPIVSLGKSRQSRIHKEEKGTQQRPYQQHRVTKREGEEKDDFANLQTDKVKKQC